MLALDYHVKKKNPCGGQGRASLFQERTPSMNLDIAASWSASPAQTTTLETPRAGLSAAPITSEAGASEQAVTDDTIPSSPPPELANALAVAAQAADRLAASGREIRFRLDGPTGKVTVEVHDLQGNVLSKLAPSKALDVAAGGSLDENDQ